jgi:hypothetical protein
VQAPVLITMHFEWSVYKALSSLPLTSLSGWLASPTKILSLYIHSNPSIQSHFIENSGKLSNNWQWHGLDVEMIINYFLSRGLGNRPNFLCVVEGQIFSTIRWTVSLIMRSVIKLSFRPNIVWLPPLMLVFNVISYHCYHFCHECNSYLM